MPCYTTPHEQCGHEDEIDEIFCDVKESLQSIIDHYKERADQATQFLCAILSKPFSINLTPTEKKELDKWWDEHQKWDKKRKEDE